MRKSVSWVSLALLLFWMPFSQAAEGWQPLPETIRKSEQDPRQYQAIRLDNAMTVLLVSDPQAVKSLVALALPIGSLDNPPQQPGLAHYLEHMLLMGSHRYPQPESLSEFLKMHGGSHNASTASYRTAFYLEVENAALEQATDRLADAIAEPLLDPVNADKERNAVNAELTMARSRDGLRMAQVGAETINPAHPGSRFAGGNLETLSDKPGSKLHDELLRFYQHYYSANLMKGVIYSNLPLPQMASIAVSTFGRIPNRQASVPKMAVPVVTDEQRGLFIHYVPARPNKQLRLEFRIDDNSPFFRSKTDGYISYLIGNRSQNTLSEWLQKQGLADSVYAGADPMSERNSGVFTITVDLTDKGLAQQDDVIAAVFGYLKQIRRDGIQQRYFDEISRMLNVDFRYPSISRDMGYVEWLVDTMLRVPVEYTLAAPYLADKFDPASVAARLDDMTPEKARIWVISPEQPHNRVAYFVDAPYQVDRISAARIEAWRQREKTLALSLPATNPYIPDDFSLITADAAITHPNVLINEPGLRLFYMPSRYFANEPKADITLMLRNQISSDTARHQVLFALNDYLAGLALDALSYQASVGGINFSTGINNGLVMKASGYTQHLPELLLNLVSEYAGFSVTEEQLAQAKSWYAEQLDAADKAKAYEQAMHPIQGLSRVPYSERSERRQLLNDITLKELMAYRGQLLQHAAPEMLVVGNLPAERVTALARMLRERLGCGGTVWWKAPEISIDQSQRALVQKMGASTDSALAAAYIPTGYDEIQGAAYSKLLGQIIHPWFFNQLRTEEQLGYAVFAMPIVVDRQWGIGFLMQSNSQQPAYLYQRYQDFFAKAIPRLRAMSPESFAQNKQGLINTISQPPQTLEEEVGRLRSDLERENFAFDTRQQLITRLSAMTVEQLANFFQQALQPQGLAVLSQVSGSSQGQSDYAMPAGWRTYATTSALQQTLNIRTEGAVVSTLPSSSPTKPETAVVAVSQ
ncbi:pitrilysin [Musicola paradisiaca]|uniref:Protease 3 n=1 Tax=Musicola paradisiaca (strain Ech703) TaxID=579405 RepID=C6CC23_MUSP7|nr:pitrilysin [Musicola paradisiaca]ACS86783.1 Pitrilysin [Musicola paradisiaca Ech703]